jgi:hypothetical protein
LSRIQSLSDVDVVLVYACDEEILRSIIEAGHHLNLFNLHPVSSWILLNPLRHRLHDPSSNDNHKSTQENNNNNVADPSLIVNVSDQTMDILPQGILSLVQQRLPLLDSPAIHYAIINLISSAANKTVDDFLSINDKIHEATSSQKEKTISPEKTSQSNKKYHVSCWSTNSSTPSTVIQDFRQLSSLFFR